MAGTITQAPNVQIGADGGIDVTWSADIPEGETVLYYTVNIYNTNTNTNALINSVQLTP